MQFRKVQIQDDNVGEFFAQLEVSYHTISLVDRFEFVLYVIIHQCLLHQFNIIRIVFYQQYGNCIHEF